MKKLIDEIVQHADAAEKTSVFKPAEQIKHLKAAFDKAIQLNSEMVSELERMRSEINSLKGAKS